METILPPTPDRPPIAELIKEVSEGDRYQRLGSRSYPRNDPIHWLYPVEEVRYASSSAMEAIPGREGTEALDDRYLFLLNRNPSFSSPTMLQRLRRRRYPTAIPKLIEALDQIEGGGSDLRLTLETLAGHTIDADDENPDARQKINEQWKQWWARTGSKLRPARRSVVRPRPPSIWGYHHDIVSASHEIIDHEVAVRAESIRKGLAKTKKRERHLFCPLFDSWASLRRAAEQMKDLGPNLHVTVHEQLQAMVGVDR